MTHFQDCTFHVNEEDFPCASNLGTHAAFSALVPYSLVQQDSSGDKVLSELVLIKCNSKPNTKWL